MIRSNTEYFSNVSANYQKKSDFSFWRILRKIEAQFFINKTQTKNIKNVLELACGTGHYAKYLNFSILNSYLGVDHCQAMLNHFSIKKPNLKLHLANIEEYTDDQSYDLIICAGGLEFLNKPELVFKNIKKMLAPKGSFLLLTSNANPLGILYRSYHALNGVKIKLFEAKEITNYCINNKLKIKETKSGIHFSHWYQIEHD